MSEKKMDKTCLVRFPCGFAVLLDSTSAASDSIGALIFREFSCMKIQKQLENSYCHITSTTACYILPVQGLNYLCTDGILEVQIVSKLLGGKGGFGSNLKKQGGRMSKKKNSNLNDFRDVAGNRLKTLRDTALLRELLENKEKRVEQKKIEIREKISEIEKKIARPTHSLCTTEYLKQTENLLGALTEAFEGI